MIGYIYVNDGELSAMTDNNGSVVVDIGENVDVQVFGMLNYRLCKHSA